MEYFFQNLLTNLSNPAWGLGILFICATLAATLLPLGSEPVLLALVTYHPELVWPALLTASLGNTLGGMIGWYMGWGAERWLAQQLQKDHMTQHLRALIWLQRLGPRACIGAWLPIIGDPLCLVAGYLRLPFWPCVVYMAIGKTLRYVVLLWGWTWWLSWWPGTSSFMN